MRFRRTKQVTIDCGHDDLRQAIVNRFGKIARVACFDSAQAYEQQSQTSWSESGLQQTIHHQPSMNGQSTSDHGLLYVRCGMIQPSLFGAINRSDRTWILVERHRHGGYFLQVSTAYQPSTWFWVFAALGASGLFLWLLPLMIYLHQQHSVVRAIDLALDQLDDELHEHERNTEVPGKRPSTLTQLAKLGELFQSGVLTREEFETEKSVLLGHKQSLQPTEEEETAQRMYERAKVFSRAENYESARKLLENLVSKYPQTHVAERARQILKNAE